MLQRWEAILAGRRWLVGGLIASLLLNLFLVGFLAGRGSERLPRAEFNARGIPFVGRVRTLPVADRIRFGLAMRRHRDEIRTAVEATRETGKAALAAIASPNYDRARAARALAGLRAARDRQQAVLHGAVLDALDEISPSSRAQLGAPLSERRIDAR
jgi:uncharacterized membrane protein